MAFLDIFDSFRGQQKTTRLRTTVCSTCFTFEELKLFFVFVVNRFGLLRYKNYRIFPYDILAFLNPQNFFVLF